MTLVIIAIPIVEINYSLKNLLARLILNFDLAHFLEKKTLSKSRAILIKQVSLFSLRVYGYKNKRTHMEDADVGLEKTVKSRKFADDLKTK